MKYGDVGECSSCDPLSEFYGQISETHAENVGNITCYSHKTGCQPGFGFKIGASHV